MAEGCYFLAIKLRIKEMCEHWPNNDDCFMLDAQDPKPRYTSKISPIVRKILRPLLEKKKEDRKFVMAFTGSSNTAVNFVFQIIIEIWD